MTKPDSTLSHAIQIKGRPPSLKSLGPDGFLDALPLPDHNLQGIIFSRSSLFESGAQEFTGLENVSRMSQISQPHKQGNVSLFDTGE